MTTDAATPKRQRGAQPGNHNNLKHGLYSRSFRQIELADLAQVSTSLDEEIAMLRVVQSRLLAFAGDFDQATPGDDGALDIDSAIRLLNTLGATSVRIASLMKAKAVLTGDDSSTLAALSTALQTVTKELGLR